MKRLKIVFPYMGRWKSANWSRFHTLFTQLAVKGHEIHVFQPPHTDSLKETNYLDLESEVHPNIHLHTVNIPSFIWNAPLPRKFNKLIKKGTYSLWAKRDIQKFYRKIQPDVIFLYNVPQYPLLSLNKSLIVFDLADDLLAMLKQELPSSIGKFVLPNAENKLNLLLSQADRVTVASKLLHERFPHSYHLPNGVDFQDMNDSNINNGLKQKLNIPENMPVLGFVGAFEYFIDFDMYFSIAEAMPEYKFLLIGAGRKFQPAQDIAKKKKLNNCIFVGAVSHHEVWKYIQIMDICVNPFQSDHPVSQAACPIKVFEYLAEKKPVVSTPLMELEPFRNNGIFMTNSVQEMVDYSRKLLTDNTFYKETGEKGYSLVKKNYNWDTLSTDFINKIQEDIEIKKAKVSNTIPLKKYQKSVVLDKQ